LVLFNQNDGLYQKWRVMSDLQGNVGFMSLMNAGVLKMAPEGKEGTQCIVSPPTGGLN
jgi:hypothetical protein